MTTERADRHLTDARTKHLQAARDKYSLRTIAPAGQEALLEAVMSIAERLAGEHVPDEEEAAYQRQLEKRALLAFDRGRELDEAHHILDEAISGPPSTAATVPEKLRQLLREYVTKLDGVRAGLGAERAAREAAEGELQEVTKVFWDALAVAAMDPDAPASAQARIVAERLRTAHDRLAKAEQQLADAYHRHERELLQRDLLIRAFSLHVGDAETARIEAEVASVIAPGT